MWDDARQLNAVAAALVGIALVALFAAALSWLVRQPAFAFRTVAVQTALVHVNPAHLEAVVREELHGTFFTMDLDRSRAAFARVPWVRKVALRRQWPARLEVTIEEHVALARWNDNALVNVDGEIFVADSPDALPQFGGADDRVGEVAQRYREWSRVLSAVGLAVEQVSVSPRGGWHLAASRNGHSLEIELGRDEPALRLTRFIAAYGRTMGVLAGNGIPVEHVDLRYRNGFAARVPGFRERVPKKGA